jgi:hypothetical protein
MGAASQDGAKVELVGNFPGDESRTAFFVGTVHMQQGRKEVGCVVSRQNRAHPTLPERNENS